jgi:predicted MPP superfamily phosphohydrolase
MVVFLGVVLALIGSIHFYFWLRLVKNTAMPMPYRAWVGIALVALALSMPVTFFVGRVAPPSARAVLAWPAFVWMGLLFLLLVALAATDLVRLGLALSGAMGRGGADPARRVFLARLLGGLAGGTAGLLGGFGMVQALARLRIKEVRVSLVKLPPALNDFTIIQLTDVHLGPTIGRAFTEQIVALANAQTPDVVAITGDLVDGSVEDLRDAAAPLALLRAKHGVYFVTGNHEYYSGVHEWLDELGRLGIRVLRNERVVVGDPGAQLAIAGVDDASAHRFAEGHGSDVTRALQDHPVAMPVVLLAHQPKTIREAAKAGVDLQISGHTHAGQIWPFSYLVRLDQPFLAGLHRTGNTQIYVSAGTGYWGPPLRLGTQAEVTKLVLRASGTRV